MKNAHYLSLYLLLASIGALVGCNSSETKSNSSNSQQESVLFKKVLASESNVTFSNLIPLDIELDQSKYKYASNGGGVCVADLNNDGLQDLVFSSNLEKSRVYLNLGNLRFEDITDSSGFGETDGGFCSGISAADVNADGWLDLYVVRSGHRPPEERSNLLFINNHDLTFTESAKEFGIADQGQGTHASFFDQDLDGDLDLYIVNHPNDWVLMNPTILTPNVRNINSDKFFENRDGHFHEASENAGLGPDGYGFGLGLGIGFVNNDIHPDIYVCNDYDGRDFLYLNNTTKGFIDVAPMFLKHTSLFSMGMDISDINNDGFQDLIVMDMNAEDNLRQKTLMPAMNPSIFWRNVEREGSYQYMYNMLQLNNGEGIFSEIGKMAGISNTDWSWSVLSSDLDLDGYKDLFITNGYPRDVNDKDIKFPVAIDSNGVRHALVSTKDRYKEYAVTPLPNYSYRNTGNLSYEKTSSQWGLGEVGLSMGAAYTDLDNDGDLEIVVNNYNNTASIFQNLAVEQGLGKGIRVHLSGQGQNKFGIGSRVQLYAGKSVMTYDNFTTRGYISSVAPVAYFGIPKDQTIDSIIVRWPNGKSSIIEGPIADLEINVNQSETRLKDWRAPEHNAFMSNSGKDLLQPVFIHSENQYNDYEKEVLLPHSMSKFGPALAVGDLNGDGLDDAVVGGAADQTAAYYIQMSDGSMKGTLSESISKGSGHEDVAAAIFDFDGDGDNDIYLGSGGNEHDSGSLYYQDRIYRNDNGKFTRDPNALPDVRLATKTVTPNDFDSDGDIDIFIGAGHIPRQYGADPSSVLLRNDNGIFTDITDEIAPELRNIGMINQAIWANIDGKKGDELILAGDWMPLTVFRWNDGLLENITHETGLDMDLGWWTAIAAHDMDNDGDLDLLAGNLGLNYKYKASHNEPFRLFAGDYDNSGSWDIVLGYYNSGQCYPVRGKQCSSQQMPGIKKKFPTYKAFGKATVYDVYGTDKLKDGIEKEATNFASLYLENDGNGQFTTHELPKLAQVSSINSFIVQDVNGDSNLDVVLAGNLFSSEIETPRNDASNGLMLLGNGKGEFEPVEAARSGFFTPGDVKQLASIRINNKLGILVGNNNQQLELFMPN